MRITLTVFFEEPFWVAVVERLDGSRLSAARHVFGPEPSEEQVHAWVLESYASLRFSPAVDGAKHAQAASNPKRRQRQAAQFVRRGTGTKARQALQAGREMQKQERKAYTKAQREAEEERRFALRLEKKKAKHRGH